MKKKSTLENCVPLQMVKKFGIEHSGIWKDMENVRRYYEEQPETEWLNFCYMPINALWDHMPMFHQYMNLSGTLDLNDLSLPAPTYVPVRNAIRTDYKAAFSTSMEDMLDNILELFVHLMCLGSWRIHKQIYEFNDEMTSMLMEQAESNGMDKIPVDVLKQMPYPCIYIDLSDSDVNLQGFFVYTDYEIENKTQVLVIAPVMLKNGKYHIQETYMIRMQDSCTMKDVVQHMKKCSIDSAKRQTGGEISQRAMNEILAECRRKERIVSYLLPLVLYICASNADIKAKDKNKPIRTKPLPASKTKDKFSEIQQWKVGEEVGMKYRKIRQKFKQDSDGNSAVSSKYITGTTMRSHIRAAHWHHYWTGPRSEPEKRKLILKWLPPVFVNADGIEEAMDVTINS